MTRKDEAGRTRLAGLHLLRDPNFRIFWIGQTVSWAGSVMQAVAQGWLVWSLTHSPGQLSLTAIVASLPLLLFSLPAGALADRSDRRILLLATQAASLLPSLLLGILAAYGTITPRTILVLAFLQGTVNAFDLPARHAILSELVPKEMLCRAVALNALAFNAARMLGPVLAGCTLAGFGAAPCFFLNALSSAVASGALLFVKRETEQPLRPESRQALLTSDLREAFFYMHYHPEIRRVLLLVTLVALFGIPFVPLLPVFADSLQVGARGLGVMSACAGGGSLAAAVALALAGKREAKRGLYRAGALFALGLLAFSRSGDYHFSLLALFVAGASLVVFLALANDVLHQGAPAGMRGRIMGGYTVALMGMAPLGNSLVGLLAVNLGAAGALSLCAAVCLSALVALRAEEWAGPLLAITATGRAPTAGGEREPLVDAQGASSP